MTEPFLRALFHRLAIHKCYPKFQYERRIDAFLSFFIADLLGVRADLFIPEFPVRAHDERRLCTNVDYLIWDESRAEVLLVELKTDKGSVDADQLAQYHYALQVPWEQLLADVRWLREGSPHASKYDLLLGDLGKVSPNHVRKGIYLAPSAARSDFDQKRKAAAELRPEYGSVANRWTFHALEDLAVRQIGTEYAAEWDELRQHLLREMVAT